MKKYKGEISNFPQEVVEWMLDEQERQGNKRDVTVFEKNKDANREQLGADFLIKTIVNNKWHKYFGLNSNFEEEQPPKSWITEWSELRRRPYVVPAVKPI